MAGWLMIYRYYHTITVCRALCKKKMIKHGSYSLGVQYTICETGEDVHRIKQVKDI